MEGDKFTFRAVNPRSDEDIRKYFELKQGLIDFLKARNKIDEKIINWQRWHLGAPEYVFPDDYKDKPLPSMEENADEFAFVCEVDDKFVGFVTICAYHVIGGKRMKDDIGVLSDIFVEEEFRGQTQISLKLLKMAIDKLMGCGKFRAICHVQEDNPLHYIHFAMADGNVILKDTCKRKDGKETIDYLLMIDLKKLNEEITNDKFVRKIGKYHVEMLRQQGKIISL